MGGNNPTVVCIKKVRGGMPQDEWDESMPLPGDIIESVSTAADGGPLWAARPGPSKGKPALAALLRRISREGVESVWVRVRRGDAVLNLRARVGSDKCAKIHRKFTLKAARDDRHIAVLADLTLDECSHLQEMSRWVIVKIDETRFEKSQGIGYDWKRKVGTYLPDQHSTVISSILFMPFPHERGVEAATTRCMAWFSAAVSSGAPLVFVNIQTEQTTSNPAKQVSLDGAVTRQSSWKELSWGRQQSARKPVAIAEAVQGIRLWFLPGVAEVLVVLAAEPDETRFGMDIRRTEEGFVCIDSVLKGSAADRAGLRGLCKEARLQGHLVVISRLEGDSVTPSLVSSEGLIHCCDNGEIRNMLVSVMDRGEDVRIHIMAWPDLKSPPVPRTIGPETSPRPPATDHMEVDEDHAMDHPHLSTRRDVDPNFLIL